MIEIAYYKSKINEKSMFCVDIICKNSEEIVRTECFETVEGAFNYSRAFEEDVLGSDFSEQVWGDKFEIVKLYYKSSENQEEYEKHKNLILGMQLDILEKHLGVEAMEELFSDIINDLREDLLELEELEEVKTLKDI